MTEAKYTPKPRDEAVLLTMTQVAWLMQVSAASVRRLMQAGDLAVVDLGHWSPRFLRREVDALITRRTRRATPSATATE